VCVCVCVGNSVREHRVDLARAGGCPLNFPCHCQTSVSWGREFRPVQGVSCVIYLFFSLSLSLADSRSLSGNPFFLLRIRDWLCVCHGRAHDQRVSMIQRC
jgi:hypothetical protein